MTFFMFVIRVKLGITLRDNKTNRYHNFFLHHTTNISILPIALVSIMQAVYNWINQGVRLVKCKQLSLITKSGQEEKKLLQARPGHTELSQEVLWLGSDLLLNLFHFLCVAVKSVTIKARRSFQKVVTETKRLRGQRIKDK